jgi:magnesium chelatase subunit D
MTLPFTALVGLELAQQALILLAIEPRLRGLVLAAPVGTGKSSLARGVRDVLGEATPFVELPPSVDVENLLGGLDLEATLQSGHMVLKEGVLARADGGVAYVDGVNLLTDASANLLLSVLDEGEVRVEREGVSMRTPARFSLIGSYDPAEGQPRRHLLDRVGLLVTLPGARSAAQRAEVIQRNLGPAAPHWAEDTQFLYGLIQTAREHLPTVHISEAQIRRLSVTALQYGVEGHRVDVFAVRAACAAAAYELRESVNDDDLLLAARLVILPRATRTPEQEEEPPQQQQQPPPPEPEPPEPEQRDEQQSEEGETPVPEQIIAPEQILEALESDLPEELADLSFSHMRRGQAGSRGTTSGTRGRHVNSVPGEAARGRIDVVATLRAAAPWQAVRGRADKLELRASDVRIKQYRSKAGALFCFGVDASGSMALHRMRQAKGAVHTLLEKAYVNRDRVALMAFRGEEAEILMPPTQSVELARRALDLLPTGGGTPLASALVLGVDLAQQAKRRGIMQTVLVLLTDGRANVPLEEGANPREELERLGGYVHEAGMAVVVVDTKRSYLSRGEARQLAEWLGATYAYLPSATGEQIAEVAAGVVE